MAFLPGKAASVTQTSARPYDTFSLDFKSEVVDTTNFTSSGYQENVAGVFSCTVSASGPYDGAESIAAGDSLSTTFATGGSGPSFSITSRLSSVKIETATRNKAATIAFTGESNGTFTVTI